MINPPENLSKLQLFGRKYWPLLATLELLALIGASLNGVLSRKRRQEIERLNVQMRAIMQRVEDERFERHNKKTSSTTSSSPAMVLIGKAKSAYANGEYESAIGLFNDAVEAADGGAFSSADEADKIEESLSARKGLATAYQASGDLNKAAATLENALLVAKDSTVFGMLGDVYTDMGELAKAGEMYDKCLEAMD
jgi:tetratricopeptide (TPR) repeat protein